MGKEDVIYNKHTVPFLSDLKKKHNFYKQKSDKHTFNELVMNGDFINSRKKLKSL